MQENISIFCNTIRNRSMENEMALELLYSNQLYSNTIAILRQELDLMVRTIFIRGITDENYRNELIVSFVEGEKWRNQSGRSYVTDRQMVEYANRLYGYTGLVYKFGCGFIHLSNLQNWLNEEVSHHLDAEARREIVRYINQYHNAGLEIGFAFADIISFIPDIFKKLHGNLECYVKDIEDGKWGND